MPKGSEERTNARKEEIIDACAGLYETMNFKEITIREIGKQTSFTRTSIYNYFQTKEEIFLALFQREYERWVRDLDDIRLRHEQMSVEGFADALAHTLEKRERLLKLLAMNHYDMEANSRMENLVAFKTAYGNSLSALSRCLEKFFPQMQEKDIEGFLYAFFPFLFGVYPYTSVTEKQTEAMDRAGVRYVCYSVREIVCSMTKKLLERYRQSAPVVL
ncbi:MAG TPA: TetR family transcriptional regulator [Candidatus Mediterraneibacter merdipullorum]|nr:TetR family transcriptional regulator [Candidatus Mediterraneibacter merdipullorum]